MQKRRFRPSPALVVAVIALFVALGGTSYAAMTLPANSVGTKQLKNNAVTSAKIANGAVTAAKISSSTVEAATVVGGAGAPAYQGNWGPGTSGGDEGVSFYKDPWGIVHIQGNAVVAGSPATGTIFTLPAGDRPAGNLLFSTFAAGGGSASIQITPDGAVNVYIDAQAFVGLSNITFRAGL